MATIYRNMPLSTVTTVDNGTDVEVAIFAPQRTMLPAEIGKERYLTKLQKKPLTISMFIKLNSIIVTASVH